MYMVDTATCGVQEIVDLCYHNSSEEAMHQFCKLNLRQKPKYHGSVFANQGQLYCFYLFTAALTYYHGGKYGSRFAAYILEHKLGQIVEAPPVQNDAFHPDHKNQAWLWAPDVKALEKWWDTHNAAKVK